MLSLPLELILEVLEESVIEIFASKVSITSSGLNSEDTTADVEERNIEGSSSKIEDKDVFLGLGLAVKTISNGGSSRLINDTKNIKSSNGASILGGETLRIVEIGGNTR